MEKTQAVSWNEALASKYIRLEDNTKKTLQLHNWTIERVHKFGEDKFEFSAVCLEEDGETCDKVFSTVSFPLMKELRTIFEERDPVSFVTVSILKKKIKATEYAYIVELVRS